MRSFNTFAFFVPNLIHDRSGEKIVRGLFFRIAFWRLTAPRKYWDAILTLPHVNTNAP